MGRGFFWNCTRRSAMPAFGIRATLRAGQSCLDPPVASCAACMCKADPQGKLVTVLRGSVLDVAVDVRTGSPNFGRHVATELSDENRRQLWIPRGFCARVYRCARNSRVFSTSAMRSNSAADELVLRWNEPRLGIDWGCDDPQLSPARPRRQHARAARRRLPALRALDADPCDGASADRWGARSSPSCRNFGTVLAGDRAMLDLSKPDTVARSWIAWRPR